MLASVSCLSSGKNNEPLAVIYNGITFNAPTAPLIVAQSNSADKMLILKYSKEKGKKYLSFSDFTIETTNGCHPQQLLSDAFTSPEKHTCSDTDVESFKKVFINGSHTKTSEKNGTKTYYSKMKEQVFIFIVPGNSNPIKVESDFINNDDVNLLIANL